MADHPTIGRTNHALALTESSDAAYTILYGTDQSYRLNLTNISGIAAAVPASSIILGFRASIVGYLYDDADTLVTLPVAARTHYPYVFNRITTSSTATTLHGCY